MKTTPTGYCFQEKDYVVLTMKRIDYERLMMLLGAATAVAAISGQQMPLSAKEILLLLNRLNEGNPHFTQYKV